MTTIVKMMFLSAFGIFLLIPISILAFGVEKKTPFFHENCHIAIQEKSPNDRGKNGKHESFSTVMSALMDLGYHPYIHSESFLPKEGLYLDWNYYPSIYPSIGPGLHVVNLLKLNPDENTFILSSASTCFDLDVGKKIFQSFPRCNKIIHINIRELTNNKICEIIKDLSREGQLLALKDIRHGFKNWDVENWDEVLGIRILVDGKMSRFSTFKNFLNFLIKRLKTLIVRSHRLERNDCTRLLDELMREHKNILNKKLSP